MSLSKSLVRWQRAGLIDATTAERIAGFERERIRPLLIYGVGGLGALTVGIGVVSVVAANWSGIPGSVKLGIDLVCLVALAAAVHQASLQAGRFATEVWVIVYYLFVLASIALVGQIYQLGSPAWQGLVVWSGCTAPLVLLGHSRFLGVLWFLGLAITYGTGFVTFFEWLDDRVPARFFSDVLASAGFATPLALLAFPCIPWLARERQELSRSFGYCAWLCAGVAGVCLPMLWYVSPGRDRLGWAIAVTAGVALAWHFSLPRLLPEASTAARRGISVFLGLVWLTLATSTSVARDALPALGAISQVGLLGVLAWTVARLGAARAFHGLTALMGVRILIMYFEVFGSLLSTGVGMITGGALTLAMAAFWNRKSARLAELARGDHGGTVT